MTTLFEQMAGLTAANQNAPDEQYIQTVIRDGMTETIIKAINLSMLCAAPSGRTSEQIHKDAAISALHAAAAFAALTPHPDRNDWIAECRKMENFILQYTTKPKGE